MSLRGLWVWGMAVLVLFLGIVAAFFVGHYPVSYAEFKEALVYWLGIAKSAQGEEATRRIVETYTILYEIRFPRIIAAVCIGASLSVSGAVFQGIFVNPLVSPSILGVLSGASFGAALGMVFHQSAPIVQLSAFIFAFVAVFFAVGIAKLYGKGNTILMLVLGGVISSSLFSALLSILKYIADPYNALPSIVYWLMGSLSSVSLQGVYAAAPLMFFSMVLLVIFSKHLNLLSLGEDEAKALGVEVEKIRLLMIVLATLLSALSVMLAGVIGWIGLVIPHIARFLVGPNHSVLLPFSALVGGIFLLLVDSLSRGFFTMEVPLGILTSLVGIPMFILILRHRAKE